MSGEGSSGYSVDSKHFLDQLLFHAERFQGIVVLVVASRTKLSLFIHRLDPDFIRRFKFLIEFSLPQLEQRQELWRRIVPAKAPLSDKVDFDELGRRFEFSGGQIAHVIYRAAAAAALRTEADQKIMMKDLVTAAEVEKDKTMGDIEKVVQQWFS